MLAPSRLRASRRPTKFNLIDDGERMTGDRVRCLEVGMNDYLSKPTRLDDLRAALHRAVHETRLKQI